MSDKNIQDILKSIIRGDEKALPLLIDIYLPYVLKIVTSLSGKLLSKEDVEEVISDVFFAVWKSRATIKLGSNFAPFLAEISRNMTKNKLRGLSSISLLDENTVEIKSADEGIFSKIASKESLEYIQSIINDFDSPEKEILYGFYFYEFKLAELARLLKLPLSTIKSKLYRSREKLKQKLMEGDYL